MATQKSKEKVIKIVAAQRGWVYVGEYSTEGNSVILTNAKCIRRWGTPGKGLGQLALEGPQPNTMLDQAGTFRIHELAVVFTLDTTQALWAKVFPA
jgi:hypothetical protein